MQNTSKLPITAKFYEYAFAQRQAYQVKWLLDALAGSVHSWLWLETFKASSYFPNLVVHVISVKHRTEDLAFLSFISTRLLKSLIESLVFRLHCRSAGISVLLLNPQVLWFIPCRLTEVFAASLKRLQFFCLLSSIPMRYNISLSPGHDRWF